MDKVTCIIPTYNSAATIKNTLRSIINQTYPDIEIIVADDCSSDETQQIAYDTLKDSRREFKILKNPCNTGGPNAGKNRGLEAATGEYITFCDHDDQRDFLTFTYQVRMMKETGCDVCTTGVQIVNTKTGEIKYRTGWKTVFDMDEAFLSILSPNYWEQAEKCIGNAVMIHRSLSHYRFENLYGVSEFSWLLVVYFQRRTCELKMPLAIRYVTGENFSLKGIYRVWDLICKKQAMLMYKNLYPKRVKGCLQKYEGSEGRYHYLQGNYKQARKHLLHAKFTWKNIAYYLSSFICPNYVKTHFHIFG